MDQLTPRTTHWLEAEHGVTAIEYGLLAGLLAVAIVASVGATGVSLGEVYTKWSGAVLLALSGVR